MRSSNIEKILLLYFRTCGIESGIFDKKSKAIKDVSDLSEQQKSILQSNSVHIEQLLKSGWTQLELEAKIRDSFRNSIKDLFIKNIILKNDNPNSKDLNRNLLDTDTQRIHKELKILKPIRISKGLISSPEPIMNKESFTLLDLIEYFKRSTMNNKDNKLLSGPFSYLLSFMNVNQILYAIDIACETIEDTKYINPLDLQRYEKDADIEISHRTA